MDTEIIQGAQLIVEYEIKILNNSEIDYDSYQYYVTGNPLTGESSIVTTVDGIVEYIDEEVILTDSYLNEDWEITTMSTLKTEGLISDQVYTNNKDRNNVYIYTGEIAPVINESYSTKVQVSKILSPSIDEMEYDNVIEIVSYNSDVGRILYDSTPGNFDIVNKANSEPDNTEENTSAMIIITPPTGQTRIYYVLGLSSLILVAIVIIIIKKKVIKRKKI